MADERRRKIYLPYPVWERHLTGRDDCGQWVPYLDGTKAVCVTTPDVAERAYAILRGSGDPEAVAAADRSEEALRWALRTD